MVEVVVTPCKVLSNALLPRVAVGAAHNVVVGVPRQAPVPRQHLHAVPISQLVMLCDEPLHQGLWLPGHLLQQFPLVTAASCRADPRAEHNPEAFMTLVASQKELL